jgi:hypothetical protein
MNPFIVQKHFSDSKRTLQREPLERRWYFGDNATGQFPLLLRL